MAITRSTFPRILPINNANRFRASYQLFIDSIFDIAGRESSDVYFRDNDIEADTSNLNIEASLIELNGVNIDLSGTVGNIFTSDTTTSASFSTPLTAAAPTGTIKMQFNIDIPSGYVVLDDGTIGNATSGATTRANDDTEDLFIFLWDNIDDSGCPVSGGRGSSAAQDFADSKTITLPKVAGRAIGCQGTGAGLTSRTIGFSHGEETHTITASEMPEHGHWFPYWDTVGSQDTSARTNYGTHGNINLADSDVPTASINSTSNPSSADRENMEATTFVQYIIKL